MHDRAESIRGCSPLFIPRTVRRLVTPDRLTAFSFFSSSPLWNRCTRKRHLFACLLALRSSQGTRYETCTCCEVSIYSLSIILCLTFYVLSWCVITAVMTSEDRSCSKSTQPASTSRTRYKRMHGFCALMRLTYNVICALAGLTNPHWCSSLFFLTCLFVFLLFSSCSRERLRVPKRTKR